MTRIAVLGAGPSGLYASLVAAEAGHQVVLFEAQGQVGGMAGSFEVAGQRVDFGSHRLHPATDPAIMARLGTLLGDDLQVRERNGRINLRNRWVGFPLRMGDMLRSLPIDFSARVAFDTLTGPLRSADQRTFHDAIRSRLGPTILSEFYGPYARKLYGAEPALLSSELADRRVAASSPLDVLTKVVRARQPAGRQFHYPRLGYGQISEALADAAVALGVDIRLHARVSALTRIADADANWRISVSGVDETAGTTEADFELVLSSIPVETVARILAPEPPETVSRSLDRLRTRGMVLVYLAVPRDQYTEFDAHYFPDESVVTARLSEPKNYRSGPDPSGQTVLCAEIACWVGDAVWEAETAELAALVTEDIDRLGLPTPDPVVVEVRRLPRVYPVFESSTAADREHVHAWASGLDGLVIFGRQGLAVPDNLHHVLQMGEAAAGAISDGEIDRRVWTQRLREFAAHVVQD